MDATAMLALIESAAQLYAGIQTLYESSKSTLSADDQVSVEAALAKLAPQADADYVQAESDLSAAAGGAATAAS